MCVGVATANSILVVSFAKEQMELGLNATEAALTAGFTRFRPVIMTALAMIIGMVPMALGLGDGGEQNAPLGRAVIGGLLIASLYTLLVVPVLYATIRKSLPLEEIGLPDATPIEVQFAAPGHQAATTGPGTADGHDQRRPHA
jgi:Cu/Ag efflux pump CusA